MDASPYAAATAALNSVYIASAFSDFMEWLKSGTCFLLSTLPYNVNCDTSSTSYSICRTDFRQCFSFSLSHSFAPHSFADGISALEKSALGAATEACDPVEILFSAKESFYKAYYPTTKFYLDFLDVDLAIDFSNESFEATLLRADAPSLFGQRVVPGRFALSEDRVFTGVVLES